MKQIFRYKAQTRTQIVLIKHYLIIIYIILVLEYYTNPQAKHCPRGILAYISSIFTYYTSR